MIKTKYLWLETLDISILKYVYVYIVRWFVFLWKFVETVMFLLDTLLLQKITNVLFFDIYICINISYRVNILKLERDRFWASVTFVSKMRFTFYCKFWKISPSNF